MRKHIAESKESALASNTAALNFAKKTGYNKNEKL
jgi:hypothetical protein